MASVAEKVDLEPLFRDAKAAIKFALSYSWTCNRPAMSRMADTQGYGGRGLSGLDGSAQAGMIQYLMTTLARPQCEILIARYAPKGIECRCGASCCTGFKENSVYRNAIDVLTAVSVIELSGCMSNHRLRVGIVRKYFGEPVKLGVLADHCNVNADTATAHNAKITKMLRREESQAFSGLAAKLAKGGVIP